MFEGFLHSNPPPFSEFSKEIRDQTKLIINHMREVLCSSDKKQELYMMGMIMRIAIGQKLQKSLFLYSGPGTGKTMLTWFLREQVLGPKITTKTANEKVITGQFNKELEGKALLVLEEMSNSKSTDWITFANRLKDFIDSDTLKIEEKYRTPYPVNNITNLIISSNNSKTIRLDKDDRRYFIPDISDKYVENGIGIDHYYAPLDKAIKNPEVGKAFYSYALEYVKLNPNFNERKIPMTKTKLMMINRDCNPLHQYIKEQFISKSLGISDSSSSFYNIFKTWYAEIVKKKPPTIQEFSHAMKQLGLTPKSKRIGERSANKKQQWYEVSYSQLYTIFLKKNMIDTEENLEIPEDYQNHTNSIENLVSEILPSEIVSDTVTAEPIQSVTTVPKTASSAKHVAKKIPPPIPSKPEHLKVKKPGPSKTSKNTEPKVMVYKEEDLENMYECAKKHWIRLGNDSEDFDWDCFIEEIENCPNARKMEDSWECMLGRVIQDRRDLINRKNGNIYSYTSPSNEVIVSEIRTYSKKRGTEYIVAPKNLKTDSFIEPKESIIDQKECERADDDIDDNWSDADDNWYDQLNE